MRAGWGGPRAVSPREGGNGRSPRSADDERYIYVAIQAPSLGRERPLVGAPRVGGNHCSPLAVLLPACSVLAFTSAGYRLLAGMFFVCWNPDHWGSSLTLATDTCVCVCVWSLGYGEKWSRVGPTVVSSDPARGGGGGGACGIPPRRPGHGHGLACSGVVVVLPVGWTLWRGPSSLEPWGPRERKVWKGEIT